MSVGATYFMEHVMIDDSDDNMEYTGVPLRDSNDSSDGEESLHTTVRALNRTKGITTGPDGTAKAPTKLVKTATLTTKPEVIDDFIMNFLVKMGMTKTADSFQTEWFALQQSGAVKAADLTAVPDAYQQTQTLDSEVRRLESELAAAKADVAKYRATWEKLCKERDHHRQHHVRVSKEKEALIFEMKRLKDQYAQYKPAMEQQQKKYDAVIREKGMKVVQVDQLKARVAALLATIAQLKGISIAEAEAEEGNVESTRVQRLGSEAGGGGSGGGGGGGGGSSSTLSPLPPLGGTRRGPSGTTLRGGTATGGKPGSAPAGSHVGGRRHISVPLPERVLINYEPLRAQGFALNNSFPAHDLSVSRVACHPSQPLAASVSDDGTWKIWTVPGGELALSSASSAHGDWLGGVAFHPLGSHLATCAGDGTIKLWNFAKQGCSMTLSEHQGAVWAVDFHHSGNYLLSASMDCTAKLFDLKVRACIATFRQHVNSVNAITFEPQRNSFATASGDKTVSVWDANSALCTSTFSGHANSVTHVAYNLQGTKVVSSDADGTVKVWDIKGSRCSATCSTSGSALVAVNSVVFDRSGEFVVAGCDDGSVKVIESSSGAIVTTIAAASTPIHSVAFDCDGTYLVAGAADGHVKVLA